MKIKEYYHDHEGYIFHFQSSSRKDITYTIAVDRDDGWFCTCEDYQFRKHKCKHILEAEKYLQKYYPSDYEIYTKLEVYVKKNRKKT